LDNFTKIPNWLLDSPNGLESAERVVLSCIYRLTAGFQRNSYKITYAQLSQMSGIKGISKVCQSLKAKGFIHFESELGKASVITILKPINSVNHLSKKVVNSVNHTHQLSSLHPSTQLITSRGAKESIKENLKKELPLELFISKYPKDRIGDMDKLNEAWSKLSDSEVETVLESMEFQCSKWSAPNVDRKYIPYASNYLLYDGYLDKEIRASVKNKKWRIKDKIEYDKYIKESEEDAASQEEIMEIIKEAKMSLNGLDK
jgi:hypothetical protein